MASEKQSIKCDTLENIELVMPKLHESLSADTKSIAVGPRVLAPFAEALATIARELRELRDRSE
jgi:hypothetical protein